jgi:hypothetical protein
VAVERIHRKEIQDAERSVEQRQQEKGLLHLDGHREEARCNERRRDHEGRQRSGESGERDPRLLAAVLIPPFEPRRCA